MASRIGTFTIRIMGPDFSDIGESDAFDARNMAAYQTLIESNALSHAEDMMNDALPDGYYAKIDQAN